MPWQRLVNPRHSLEQDLTAAIDDMTGEAHGRGELTVPLFTTILVATNGSATSLDAIDWACSLAKPVGARVHLISVGSPGASERLRQRDASLAFESGIANHDAALRQGVERCAAKGVAATSHAATGSPALEVGNACQRLGANLLIVGAGHEGRVEFSGIGSVAHQLKALVPHSVLVARGPPTTGPVVCGVDGSRASQVAARVAVGIAHALDASVVVLHVRPSGGPVRLPRPMKPASWTHAPLVTFESATGNAASTLTARSRALRASLLVLGGRGASGVPGWSLGSVSDHTSSHADGSVLVVKTRA